MKIIKNIPIVLSLVFILAFHKYSRAQYHIPQQVFGNGGVPLSNGSYRVNGTVGQSVIGVGNSSSQINQVGFWYQSVGFTNDVESVLTDLPTDYRLEQNYPNPFNPVTTISYQLSANSQVDMSIYNIQGQKIATIISQKQPPGSYTVTWNADSYSSGVYFCRIEANASPTVSANLFQTGFNNNSENIGNRFTKVIKLALVK